MSDIARRFHQDVLTLTAPIDAGLAAQGVDVDQDVEFMALVEPDTVRDAYRLQMAGGTQVLVTATRGITPAQLARHGLEDRLEEMAVAALAVAKSVQPQHTLVEVWPCALPLDPTSANSMKEHRDQYARVAKVFEQLDQDASGTGTTAFDGYLLGGFTNLNALKAAMAGIRKVTDKPLFCSVCVDAEGNLAKGQATLEDAAAVVAEFGGDVMGFATFAGPEVAADFARRLIAVTDLPIMATLAVAERNPKQGAPTAENPYYTPDVMFDAAATLRAAGVQFLRAGSAATPAYTAVLAAATAGTDVKR